MMVGRLVFVWDDIFAVAMLNFRWVAGQNLFAVRYFQSKGQELSQLNRMCEHLAHHTSHEHALPPPPKKNSLLRAFPIWHPIYVPCFIFAHGNMYPLELPFGRFITSSALGLCQLGQTCHHTYQMRHHPIKKSWNWSIWYRFIYHLIHDTQSASTSLECAYSFSLTSSSWQSRATFHDFCKKKIQEHKGSMSTTREAKTKPWPPERLASPTVLPIA